MKKSLLAVTVTLLLFGCGSTASTQPELPEPPKELKEEVIRKEVKKEIIKEEDEAMKATTQSGLQYEIFQEGDGNIAKRGDTVSVHYTGWLLDGTKFDSSVDRGTPFQFVLGARQVIKGWDEGVEGMKVGEERRLTIPSDLAYGDQDRGKIIKAGSTLVFDVELVEIVK